MNNDNEKLNSVNVNINISSERSGFSMRDGASCKSKAVALILCVTFGVIGAHLFYVGRGQKGVLYIFTFGFFFIGVGVDLLLILSNSFEDAFEMKLREW